MKSERTIKLIASLLEQKVNNFNPKDWDWGGYSYTTRDAQYTYTVGQRSITDSCMGEETGSHNEYYLQVFKIGRGKKDSPDFLEEGLGGSDCEQLYDLVSKRYKEYLVENENYREKREQEKKERKIKVLNKALNKHLKK